MWEASFVGYDEEHHKNADKKIKSIEKSRKDTVTYTWEKFRMEILGYSKKQIREQDKYEKRKNKSGIRDIEQRSIIAQNKYHKASLRFQVNEIRNNNLFLEDRI